MTKKKTVSREPGSFRDPSGFIFYKDNSVYRQIQPSYKPHLKTLASSGLLKKLEEKGWILPHESVKKTHALTPDAIAVYRTERIPFVSYPYEWSFSQLKDAALLTLAIQKLALNHGMSLKDASSYNIQYIGSKPVFIDLLSFENQKKHAPWIAYRQFCQHFLAPLLLMSKVDLKLQYLLRHYLDGIPLDLASKLLPARTYLSFGIASHIHLHAKNQQKHAADTKKNDQIKLNDTALLGILDSLEGIIRKLSLSNNDTEWAEYYTFTNYSDKAFSHKKEVVGKFVKKVKPDMVWDLGANTGEFSKVAAEYAEYVVASDIDPVAINSMYKRLKTKNTQQILPLLLDLTNPSPDLGFFHQERKSLENRGPADLVLALALIHHLAISNNTPLDSLAQMFSSLGKFLIVEFVPKADSKVQILLATREDIFPDYTKGGFESAFQKYFTIIQHKAIKDSERYLYLMKRR